MVSFETSMKVKVKNPAAVELGRKGGQAKVPKGTAMLSKAERRRRGREAAEARWGKKRKQDAA
jgi:hypothetical protein